jgi:LPS sulfotransferase NodH
MLKATGVAGFPSEHLQAMTQELVKNCHFDSLRYLKILMTNQVTNNGVFGTKFISNFLLDHQRFDPNFTQVFETHIPKFIFLTRKDKLAQAVSILVAKTTHVWHSFQIDTAEEYQDRIGKIDVECVDLERINRIYKTLVRQERKIKKLLRKYKIKPLVIEYEKFTGNPEANIKKILNYLDIKDEYAPIDTNRVKTRKLSSDVSKRIIERYNSEYLQSHKQMTVDLEEKVVRLIK